MQYSNNIIFFDGEFNGLNPNGTEFLSMAFITPDNKELYLETEPPKLLDTWVQAEVMPHMQHETKINESDAKKQIDTFIEKNYGREIAYTHADHGEQIRRGGAPRIKPFLIADVNQFDWMGICGLFGVWDIPFHYIPIDFASILFNKGIDPDIDRINFARSLGIDVSNFKKHNALDDCRVLKQLYERI